MAHTAYLTGKLVVVSTYLVGLVAVASIAWCINRAQQHGHIMAPYALAWVVLSATQVEAAHSA